MRLPSLCCSMKVYYHQPKSKATEPNYVSGQGPLLRCGTAINIKGRATLNAPGLLPSNICQLRVYLTMKTRILSVIGIAALLVSGFCLPVIGADAPAKPALPAIYDILRASAPRIVFCARRNWFGVEIRQDAKGSQALLVKPCYLDCIPRRSLTASGIL